MSTVLLVVYLICCAALLDRLWKLWRGSVEFDRAIAERRRIRQEQRR